MRVSTRAWFQVRVQGESYSYEGGPIMATKKGGAAKGAKSAKKASYKKASAKKGSYGAGKKAGAKSSGKKASIKPPGGKKKATSKRRYFPRKKGIGGPHGAPITGSEGTRNW
jgi:hypothetical protein